MLGLFLPIGPARDDELAANHSTAEVVARAGQVGSAPPIDPLGSEHVSTENQYCDRDGDNAHGYPF